MNRANSSDRSDQWVCTDLLRQRRIEMSEVITEIVAQEGAVLTVLMYLKDGKINDAAACFAEKFEFKDWGLTWSSKTGSAWLNSSRRPGSSTQILRCKPT